jgi:hypothetical protein
MKVLCAIIPFIGIIAALPEVLPNLSEGLLEKRTGCQVTVTGGYWEGNCVDTNNGNSCPGGFLVEGFCPGANSEICCVNSPNTWYCLGSGCTCDWEVAYIMHLQSNMGRKRKDKDAFWRCLAHRGWGLHIVIFEVAGEEYQQQQGLVTYYLWCFN